MFYHHSICLIIERKSLVLNVHFLIEVYQSLDLFYIQVIEKNNI